MTTYPKAHAITKEVVELINIVGFIDSTVIERPKFDYEMFSSFFGYDPEVDQMPQVWGYYEGQWLRLAPTDYDYDLYMRCDIICMLYVHGRGIPHNGTFYTERMPDVLYHLS